MAWIVLAAEIMTDLPPDPELQPPGTVPTASASSNSERSGWWIRLAEGGLSQRERHALLGLIAALVIGTATLPLSNAPEWRGLKPLAAELIVSVLAVWVLMRGRWPLARLKALPGSGPNFCIVAWLVWIWFSARRSEFPRLSQYEVMGHIGGALLYFSVVYGFAPRHLPRLALILAVAVAAGSLLALTEFQRRGGTGIAGAFRDDQLLGGFLCLSLPVLAALVLTDGSLWRRAVLLTACVLGTAALLSAKNRSAWLGASVGLLVIALLYWRLGANRGRPRNKRPAETHHLVIAGLTTLLAAGLFFGMTGQGGMLLHRVATIQSLGTDDSSHFRRERWRAGLRMAQQRPMYGWGIGTFAIHQALFNPSSRSQREILVHGGGLSENPHNTYVRLAAEVGYPGLVLFLAIPVAFFLTAARAIQHLRGGLRRNLVLGCLGGIAAMLVSATTSPTWDFVECMFYFWFVLGLGMSAAGIGTRGTALADP